MNRGLFYVLIAAVGLLGPHPLYAKIVKSSKPVKVHYVDKGVKYHIGDNRYEASEDATFVGASPVVGQEWVRAFKVSEADEVKVHIDKIWGVDDCPYCKIIVSIDGIDMIRLFQSNNNEPADTPEPLGQTLQPGVTHILKIVSYGDDQVDDFMVQDISVLTQRAEVEWVVPDEPTPTPTPVRVINPCQSAAPKIGWVPGEDEGKDRLELWSKGRQAVSSGTLGSLEPGEALEFFVQVDSMEDARDITGHALEFRFQTPRDDEGWVISFQDNRSSKVHGNMIHEGIYHPDAFEAGAFRPGSWNQVRIHSCADGKIHLLFNGQEASLNLPSNLQGYPFLFRAVGLKAVISKNPRAFQAPTPVAPLLPPPPGS